MLWASGARPLTAPSSARVAMAWRSSASAARRCMRSRSGRAFSRARPFTRESISPSSMTIRSIGSSSFRVLAWPKSRLASATTAARSSSSAGRRFKTTRKRKTAFTDTTQHLPRHQVGVAGRGGDENAEIAGLNQNIGELAVVTIDGVDVGRVDNGNPVRACGRRRASAGPSRQRRDDRSRQFDPRRSRSRIELRRLSSVAAPRLCSPRRPRSCSSAKTCRHRWGQRSITSRGASMSARRGRTKPSR